ncbi:hypothetical protein CXG81DRAFT_12593 [Caulochytrium protostelioides]|uniref:ERCC4 domain-containing protein n=1 Tax=Caulochytrium protostelioides TaxID=1555241 RepID=A0A4P9X6W9_9FUNG|nr:hypothetical protein CXG81DRAFT_12593 [Caulochytrium protostelioides]|eukprot:RKP00956.1 hypothetical protein CXG81DRAFT_12593 [Caulochytrium protostelioides]
MLAADAGDGLLITAQGLGLRASVIPTLIALYADPRHLVLVLGLSAREYESLQRTVAAIAHSTPWFRLMTADTPASERHAMYREGGVIAVTSRILVVDLLNAVVPTAAITGMMVLNAHRVTDRSSTEAFILRLYRDTNKTGFIKAFSDVADGFTHGYWKLERSMKTLFLRRVFLWPRFHTDVAQTLSQAGRTHLVEIRVPLSPAMRAMQDALLACIETCISDLKKGATRAGALLDLDQISIEHALFPAFDLRIRAMIAPLWHKTGPRTRQLLQDITTLRSLLAHLLAYDAVTMHCLLETMIMANAVGAHGDSLRSSDAGKSPWLLYDAAQVLFERARARVFTRRMAKRPPSASAPPRFPPTIQPVLEEQPKWRVLLQILQGEIEPQRMTPHGARAEAIDVDADVDPPHPAAGDGLVLVMCAGERTCGQLRRLLAGFDLTERRFCSPGARRLMENLLENYFAWKGHLPRGAAGQLMRPPTAGPDGSAAASTGASASSSGSPSGSRFASPAARGSPAGGSRRRVRGASTAASGLGHATRPPSGPGSPAGQPALVGTTAFGLPSAFASEVEEMAHELDAMLLSERGINEMAAYGLMDPSSLLYIKPYAQTASSDDEDMLEALQPKYIIMYDVDMAFVRQVELYSARHPEQPVYVYFMVYDNSVEEQVYLSSIRREKQAFETLIHEKSVMAIPIQQDGRLHEAKDDDAFIKQVSSRVAGGQTASKANAVPRQVIVDVREFRSSLPNLIHQHGMAVRPCTLEVGDYILTPNICVERKSIPDLISSFKSGRLYTQAMAMCAHYATPVLLIEFESGRSFHLQTLLGTEISGQDLGSRLSLLALTFPALRIMWSAEPRETAMLFLDAKMDRPEPDLETAIAVGLEGRAGGESATGAAATDRITLAANTTALDMLRTLPGMPARTARHAAHAFHSIAALADLSEKELSRVIGDTGAQTLYRFLHRGEPGVAP